MKEERVELPKHLRQKLIDEIRNRLRSLDGAVNTTEQHGGCKIDSDILFELTLTFAIDIWHSIFIHRMYIFSYLCSVLFMPVFTNERLIFPKGFLQILHWENMPLLYQNIEAWMINSSDYERFWNVLAEGWPERTDYAVGPLEEFFRLCWQWLWISRQIHRHCEAQEYIWL